jgi:hypothetical protein
VRRISLLKELREGNSQPNDVYVPKPGNLKQLSEASIRKDSVMFRLLWDGSVPRRLAFILRPPNQGRKALGEKNTAVTSKLLSLLLSLSSQIAGKSVAKNHEPYGESGKGHSHPNVEVGLRRKVRNQA